MYRVLWFFYLVVSPVVWGSWSDDDETVERSTHRDRYHITKRHMVQTPPVNKMKTSGPKRMPPHREGRKKLSGHLTPLEEDDMDNEEVVSVAIHPPSVRRMDKNPRKPARLDKLKSTHQNQNIATTDDGSPTAAELLKSVLLQLGQEFMLKQADENFVFGQYVSGSMRNMTSKMKIQMQHEILDLIVKYQKDSLGIETTTADVTVKGDKKANETDELDFSSLSKFVG